MMIPWKNIFKTSSKFKLCLWEAWELFNKKTVKAESLPWVQA